MKLDYIDQQASYQYFTNFYSKKENKGGRSISKGWLMIIRRLIMVNYGALINRNNARRNISCIVKDNRGWCVAIVFLYSLIDCLVYEHYIQ